MAYISLLVDPLTLVFRANGPATGKIVLTISGVVFPNDDWNDFVVVIVEAWITAFIKLLVSNSQSERVYFMDGPYAVDVSMVQPGIVQVRAIERPYKECACDISPIGHLVENAIEVAETVLDACRGASYRSVDVERLDQALCLLRRKQADANA